MSFFKAGIIHTLLFGILYFIAFNSFAAPVFIGDEVTPNSDFGLVFLNRPEVLNVLDNDYGLNSGISSMQIVDAPNHGSTFVNDDYTITYMPELNFEGEDVFKYEVCNKDGSCGIAEVAIEVVYFDYKPGALNDSITLFWTPEKFINVTQNDTGILNYPLSLDVIWSPALGRYSLSGDSAIIYSPNRGQYGRDSIGYTICDAENDCSEAWLQIELLNSEETELFIPNGFSPNQDGINDVFFVPQFKNVSLVKLKIFTAWGALVFESDNYKNNWDGIGNAGMYKGKTLDVGTYYYQFEVPDFRETYTGYIYLNK